MCHGKSYWVFCAKKSVLVAVCSGKSAGDSEKCAVVCDLIQTDEYMRICAVKVYFKKCMQLKD